MSQFAVVDRSAGARRATRTPLDDLQIGHLRHVENLARNARGDWSLMTIDDPFQEGLDSYRYQIAYMMYALALAHYNRLPNAPGVFKQTFERLMEKLLHPEVWFYWRDTSRGAPIWKPETRAGFSERWDPVKEDNIMFSAYVQSLALLYNVLFDDPRYAEQGALTFRLRPHMWKPDDDEREFAWDQNSLNENIYWQMVESGYLGIACEPNCIFPICNQPAILGFRMHDVLTGASRAKEVTAGWLAAWEEFGGLVTRTGHYQGIITEDDHVLIPGMSMSSDGWLGALLHMWHPELVERHYEFQRDQWLCRGSEGRLSVRTAKVLAPGGEEAGPSPDLGWAAAWASEMGDGETLHGLLAHADAFMSPAWERGGLFYPRNESSANEDGNLTLMDRLTGNALLAYARLNVADGFWNLYNRPWDESHFREPLLTEVSGVDIRLAHFACDENALRLVATPREGYEGAAELVLENVFGRGSWRLSLEDGSELARSDGVDVKSGGGQLDTRRVGSALRVTGRIDERVHLRLRFDTSEFVA